VVSAERRGYATRMGMTMKLRTITAAQYETATSDELRDLLRYGQPGVVDLDKAWDGIAWLISEERRERPEMLPDPSELETRAIYGIDPEDRVLLFRTSPDDVKEIAAAIGALDDAALRKNFTPAQMSDADVYPSIWDEGDEALEYLLGNFHSLRRVYTAAASKGDAVAHVID
jgi:hypothetical protein